MRGSYTKEHSIVQMTIHELKIPQAYDDMFQVEWKRGDNHGITTQVIPNDNCIVSFEKEFKLPVTMYISKRDGKFKEKRIKFKIYRFIGVSGKKTFGEVIVDVSNYYGKAATPETFNVKSPHKEKSTITLSFTVTPEQKSSTGYVTATENDLTSVTENVPISDIHATEWDVSDISTPESQERLKQWCEEQAALESNIPSLSNFQKIPKRRIKQLEEQLQRQNTQEMLVESANKSRMQRRPSDGLIAFLGVQKAHQNTHRKRRLSHHRSTDLIDIIEESPIVTEAKEKIDEIEEIRNFFASLFAKTWCVSPVQYDRYSSATSAIFAGFQKSNLFEADINDSDLQQIINDIIEKLRNCFFIENQCYLDSLIFLSQISYLLLNEIESPNDRHKMLVEQINSQINLVADEIISPLFENIRSIANEVTLSLIDHESLIKSLTCAIEKVVEETKQSGEIKEFLKKKIIDKTDRILVNCAVRSPFSCTFSSAITWNSLITTLDASGYPLPLFREVASTLMMGTAISAEPHMASEVCPLLPKETIYVILANQQADEYQPMPNDVVAFAAEFHIKMDSPKEVSEVSPVGTLNNGAIGSWKDATFSEDELESYSFLKDFFIHN